MKKILLDENLNFYRANLHCHSTISDGKKTPEELKRFYMDHGYSAVAFTDHEVFIPHNDLTDDNFVALNAIEIDPSGDHSYAEHPDRCHFCLIAKNDQIKADPLYRTWAYTTIWDGLDKWLDRTENDPNEPEYDLYYDGDVISGAMKRAHDRGFFVTYNHPDWSRENYTKYSKYSGMDAMEIVNFGCQIAGFDDDNGHCYNDLLNQGKKIFAVATDDNHNWPDDNSIHCDSFGGATVLAAPELSYDALIAALESGSFYATAGTSTHRGPDFRSIVWEDGKVTVKTSDVRSISTITSSRHSRIALANDGETISEGSFEPSSEAKWFRFVAVDREGYKAYSNAYFVEDIK